ncbi:YIP1 family protein [Gloeocapsopsis crepidinum LEGE 06123]|uniref:YIP1 family protein n=1 Tax=Gloeocapsopsis crepidinum LEGE 06123 TaxID=588587 RepID=A0ABR9UUZ6_9CHRO|nr:YIP1 family protein [Gloeocapsopsis crepidinum]MBE9192117.1 YIP1 family protein [Gloeocapsopsis crepidinum LEGE 06123]
MSARKDQWKFRTSLREALTLDAHFYEDAPNTRKTRRVAKTIVIVAAISYALGNAFILLINRVNTTNFVFALILNVVSVILGYYFWTFTIWKIGDRFKPRHVTYQELLVPIGFAYAPQVFNFLTLIPLLGIPIQLVLAVWSLLAVIVAVRQGLDISNVWAAVICLIGWPLIQLAVGSVQLLFIN